MGVGVAAQGLGSELGLSMGMNCEKGLLELASCIHDGCDFRGAACDWAVVESAYINVNVLVCHPMLGTY